MRLSESRRCSADDLEVCFRPSPRELAQIFCTAQESILCRETEQRSLSPLVRFLPFSSHVRLARDLRIAVQLQYRGLLRRDNKGAVPKAGRPTTGG